MYFLILREPTVPQVHTQLIPADCSGVQGVWRFFLFLIGRKENKVWFGPHQTLSQFRGAFTLLDYLYCARTLPLPFNYISMSCPLDICIEAVKHKKKPCFCRLCSYQEGGRNSTGDSQRAGLGCHTAPARGSDRRRENTGRAPVGGAFPDEDISCGGRGRWDRGDGGRAWQPDPDPPGLR